MPIEIRVPQMAESVHEATVGKWFKDVGDEVSAGETVVELETDKVNLEVTAGQPGRLEQVVRKTGETVTTGDVLAVIAEGVPGAAAQRPATVAPRAATAVGVGPAPAAPDITPVARNLAETAGLDISKVRGTGPGGRISKEDVEAHIASGRAAPVPAQSRSPQPPAQTRPAPPAPAAAQPRPPAASVPAVTASTPTPPARTPGADRVEERVRLSRRRLTIAQRLSEVNRQAVMTTTFNEVDMAGIAELRRKYRQEFRDRNGVDLGLMSFFIKATVTGLQAFPVMNTELQGEELVYKRYFDIGIAVAADEGLLVPVVRDADHKNFAEIERDVAALALKARERKLTLDELRGGTFTITNGGIFGSLMSTPILNPPQVGIMGMHRILERPVAVGGQVVVRPMMYLAVTYDHRVVDGADAVRFLVRVKDLLEDPGRLLVHA